MGRSGYTEWDGDDQWAMIRWAGAIASAFRGRRGQAFLREMLSAMDALPAKRLMPNVLVSEEGCCAMGSVAVARGQDVSAVDPEVRGGVGAAFGIAEAMVAEIAYENDEGVYRDETPEQRWQRMRTWTAKQIAKEAGDD